jgi:hypothetical protein
MAVRRLADLTFDQSEVGGLELAFGTLHEMDFASEHRVAVFAIEVFVKAAESERGGRDDHVTAQLTRLQVSANRDDYLRERGQVPPDARSGLAGSDCSVYSARPVQPGSSPRLPRLRPILDGFRGWDRIACAIGLASLVYVSARQGFTALDPVSLWLDDLWVATLVKRASLVEVWQLKAPAPYGFIVIEKLVRAAFGDGQLQLQAAPYLARLVSIAALGWLAAELTGSAGIGLLAATGLALQSELAIQSLRVKQYSLDVLLCVMLLGFAIAALRRPSLGRLAWFGFASLVALPCSFPSAFIGPALFSLCALAYAYDQRLVAPAVAVRALGLMLLFDALCAALLLSIVQQKATPALQNFWAEYYPERATWRALRKFYRAGPGRDFLTGAFAPLPWLAWLVPIGVIQLLRQRWTRALGVFVVLLHGAVLLSGIFKMYPLGVPRLDLYIRPVQLLAAAAALQPLAASPRLRSLIAVPALIVALVAASQLTTQSVEYVPAGEKPLAAHVERWLSDPTTGLLLFPWANWAFAYYTDSPVKLVPVTDSTNGFFAIPERPQSVVLRETWQGTFFADYARDAAVFDQQLAALLQKPPPKLVFYGSFGDVDDYRSMLGQLKRLRYVVVDKHAQERALAVLLERR